MRYKMLYSLMSYQGGKSNEVPNVVQFDVLQDGKFMRHKMLYSLISYQGGKSNEVHNCVQFDVLPGWKV